MPATGTKTKKNRDETINLRASRRQKALIDRAADALGRNRSDFMLETACREAEAVLLDRRYFALTSEEFRRFNADAGQASGEQREAAAAAQDESSLGAVRYEP
jgi:uncharacterized protein (DUF1778 family)